MRKRAKRLAKLRGRSITLMTVPDGTGRVKKFRVPLAWALTLSLMLLSITAFVFYITYNYAYRTLEISQYRQQLATLEQENVHLSSVIQEQDQQLQGLADQADALLSEVSELEQVRAQIEEVLKVKVSELSGKQSSVPEIRVKPPIEVASRGDAGNEVVVQTETHLAQLRSLLPQSAERLTQLKDSAQAYSDRRARMPSIWPLTVAGRVTSDFGPRMHPIQKVVKVHDGLDIAAPLGTPIRATANGVVSFSGRNGGYGWQVTIDHGYGVETLYAHNQKNLVKKGQRVSRGEIIAYVGSTGISTGPHVHYEVKLNGKPVNPRKYFP